MKHQLPRKQLIQVIQQLCSAKLCKVNKISQPASVQSYHFLWYIIRFWTITNDRYSFYIESMITKHFVLLFIFKFSPHSCYHLGRLVCYGVSWLVSIWLVNELPFSMSMLLSAWFFNFFFYSSIHLVWTLRWVRCAFVLLSLQKLHNLADLMNINHKSKRCLSFVLV